MLSSSCLVALLASMFRMSTPLIFSATGESTSVWKVRCC